MQTQSQGILIKRKTQLKNCYRISKVLRVYRLRITNQQNLSLMWKRIKYLTKRISRSIMFKHDFCFRLFFLRPPFSDYTRKLFQTIGKHENF
jgi:hypothetical protein